MASLRVCRSRCVGQLNVQHCFCAVFIMLLWKSAGMVSHGRVANPKLVCYYASWATYREGAGKFTPLNIDPHLCTHIISTSAGVGWGGGISVLDPHLSFGEQYGKDDFRKLFDLKRYNSNLKLLIGIGGHGEKSANFPSVVVSSDYRKFFIDTVIRFLEQYQFDGISIDWMYPTAKDRENYTALLRELRKEFGSRWILSVVGSAIDNSGYDQREISKYVDFINLWSFDYHGAWEHYTGHNAPLYQTTNDTSAGLFVDYSVRRWLDGGMEASKLILGIPTFGRTFTLKDLSRTGVKAPTFGSGEDQSRFQQYPPVLGYNELQEEFKLRRSWKYEWDNEAKVPFAHSENQWVTYDDESSIRHKALYIGEKELGGAMVYSLDTDDFHGTGIHSRNRKFHLITAVKEGLAANGAGIKGPIYKK